MNRYYDTHIHLDLIKNESLEKIKKKIEEDKIYVVAVTNLPDLFIKLNNQIKSKYIRVCLGFHPELVYEYHSQIPKMWKNLSATRYIGEVGLDFSNNILNENKKIQIDFFKNLINKCEEYNDKILSIHSRNAENEIIDIIKNVKKSKLIIHWYSGELLNLERLIKKEVYFSINEKMCKSKKGQSLIKQIPTNKILIETDYPFINNTYKTYSKKNLIQIIFEISKIKNIDYNEIEKRLFQNFKELII